MTNFNVNFFYNQSLNIPDSNTPHIAIQTRSTIFISNSWTRKEKSDSIHFYRFYGYEDYVFKHLKEKYLNFKTRTTGGLVQIRESTRYNLSFITQLSSIAINSFN